MVALHSSHRGNVRQFWALLERVFVKSRSHGTDNTSLVQALKSNGIIRSKEVEDAMLKVDRGNYVARGNPYEDSPQPIGYAATISAPHMASVQHWMNERTNEDSSF